MSSTVAWIVLGSVAAIPYLALARRSRRPVLLSSAGLVVASLIYVALALGAGAGSGALGLEGLGVVAYGALAGAGVVGSPLWTAAGWLLHAVWDVGHAPQPAGYVANWYRLACVGFDLAVAGAIGSRYWPGTDPRFAGSGDSASGQESPSGSVPSMT